jgi:hypothetical protein
MLGVHAILWLVWAAMLLARIYFSDQVRRGERPGRFGQFFASPKWLTAYIFVIMDGLVITLRW